MKREPDFVIGGKADPYLRRWWIIPRDPAKLKIYLHQMLRDDEDRALHDHPSWNLSIVLRGGYIERTFANGRDATDGLKSRVRRAGSIIFRRADCAHRLELIDGPSWSLFFMGPQSREWGFHCPKGWVHWQDFTNPADGGATVGRGCGETA